jgi:hypothetical protein
MDRYEDDNTRFLHLKRRKNTIAGEGTLLNLSVREIRYGNKKITFYLATT